MSNSSISPDVRKPKPTPNTALEALAMRIVGELAADGYVERGITFEAWGDIVNTVCKALRRGAIGVYVVDTDDASFDIEKWIIDRSAVLTTAD